MTAKDDIRNDIITIERSVERVKSTLRAAAENSSDHKNTQLLFTLLDEIELAKSVAGSVYRSAGRLKI